MLPSLPLVSLYQRGQPGSVVIVDASTAADGLRRASLHFCLLPVFVYRWITGMTLQISCIAAGETWRKSTVHKPTRTVWLRLPLSGQADEPELHQTKADIRSKETLGLRGSTFF